MEIDLYFEPMFWSRRGTPRKTQKPAAENCIFLPRKIVNLTVNTPSVY